MKFKLNALHDLRNASKTATINAGRFKVAFNYDSTMLGGLKWRIANEDAVRPNEFPLEGVVYHSDDVPGTTILLLSELVRYDEFLAVEEAIAANPEKYRREAEKAMKAEEAEAAKAAKAAEAAAMAEAEAAKAAERERQAALEAERQAAAKVEAQRQAEDRKLRLEARIREAAAREVAAR